MRKFLALVATVALLALPMAGAAAATADQTKAMAAVGANTSAGCQYFPETQHNLCGGFLRYWQTYGGLAVYGFPLTEEFQEKNPDTGQVYTVQYFERARFEWHPGEWPARWDVELGRLGYWYAVSHDLLGTKPFQRVSGCPAGGVTFQSAEVQPQGGAVNCIYFPATGHTLQGAFADYWLAHGGLAVFGFPISEAYDANGLQVQYFERQRFEWHPETHSVMLGLLGDRVLMGSSITPYATGLDNPRQLAGGADPDNGSVNLWVAEAGKGGDNCKQTPPDPQSGQPGMLCYGTTGAIAQIVNGKVVRTIGGFPSISTPDVIGPTSVSSNTPGVAWVIIGGPGGPQQRQQAVDLFGESVVSQFGKLYKVDLNTGTFTAVADLAAYEYANNPDKGDVNEQDDPLDTNAYSVYDTGTFVLVADAGANDLLKVDYTGKISTVAVLPPGDAPAPPFIPAPPGTMIKYDSVPTTVVVGPDGNYYVGELTGFPFQVGKANVYKVDAKTGNVSVYASGFTNIIDIAFDSTGHLFVLEIAEHSLLSVGGENGPPTPAETEASPGALIRVNQDGSQTKIADVGLPVPGGLAIGPDSSIFVTTYSVFNGIGSVVKVDY